VEGVEVVCVQLVIVLAPYDAGGLVSFAVCMRLSKATFMSHCAYVCDKGCWTDVEGQGEEQCAVLCRCCVCAGSEW
jgi:hypothetical protein